MTDELFPVEQVQCDSPRLRWMKKHGVSTHSHESREDWNRWIAWLWDNEDVDKPGVPYDLDRCGYGKTEEEAVVQLAQRTHIKLWNEETP